MRDADARDRPPVRPHPPVLGRRDAGRRAAERAAAGGQLADRAAGRAAAADRRDRARSSTSVGGRAPRARATARVLNAHLPLPSRRRYVESPRGEGAPQARAPGTRGRREGVRRAAQAHAGGLRRRARRASPSVAASWSSVVVVLGGGDDGRAEVAGQRGAASRPSRRPTSRRPRRPRAASSSTPPNEGAGHEEKEFKASDYKQNPPTSGNHFPQWYEDGIYSAGRHAGARQARAHARARADRHPVQAGHARRRPSPSSRRSSRRSTDGYHMLLFENGPRCRSPSPRPPGTTSSAARR